MSGISGLAGDFGTDTAGIAVFSEEERRDIGARIEAAAARTALPLPRPPARGEAEKKGLFPLFVNIAALAVLVGGFFLLSLLHRSDTVEIRESASVLGITERKLIEEIRLETNRLVGEKDASIDAMNNRIAEVDAELVRLDSLEALTDEQRAAMEELRRQQDEYRGSLSHLQTERAQIIAEARQKEAEARQREANLHERLEEQQGMLENLSAQSRAEIETARNELARLSSDQEKGALIERQLSGFYAAASRQIQAGQYREAAQTIGSLKEYLVTPSFQSIRSFAARRESDTAAAAALSVLVAEALKAGSVPAAPAGTAASGNSETALRQQLAGQKEEQAAAVLADREAALARVQQDLAEAQARNAASLQTLAERERTLADRDRQINNLRTQNTAYAETIDTQQKTISNLTAELERR